MYIDSNCIRCHQCVAACPEGCLEPGAGDGIRLNRDCCLLPECGACQHGVAEGAVFDGLGGVVPGGAGVLGNEIGKTLLGGADHGWFGGCRG